MKNKTAPFLLLALASLPTLAWASPVEHLQSTLETNDQYRQIQNTVNAAERDVVVNKAALLPQVRGNTSYRLDERPTNNSGNRQERFNSSVSATQQLFNYSLLGAVKVAQHSLELARHRATDVRQQILQATYRAYLSTALAKQRITLLDRRREHLNEQLRFATSAFDFGKASRLDIVNVEAQLAALKAERIAAEGSLETARRSLASLSGLPATDVRNLVSQPLISSGDRNVWLAKAKRVPAVRIASTQLQLQDAAIEQARGSILPSLSMLASTDLAGEHGLFLQANVPIFSSGGASAALERLEFLKEGQAAARDQALEDASLAIRNALYDLQLQSARSEALTDSVAIATERLELANASIELRAGVLSDALSAESDLAAAELELLRSSHAQLEAWITLLATVGELSLERAQELERLFG